MVNNYKYISRYYERLKRFVFGRALDQAAAFHLLEYCNQKNVLVVGGGAGKILEALQNAKSVVFVDLSPDMIAQAKRVATPISIQFVCVDFFEFESDQDFDVILFPFFLDLFNERDVQNVINKSMNFLNNDGYLIVTDFEPKVWWQKMLVQVMYFFFTFCTNVPNKKIRPIDKLVSQCSVMAERKTYFLNKLVFSSVYRKP